MTTVTDLAEQSRGIDRIVHLTTRDVTVEEKQDCTVFPNIAFEVESTAGRTKGWALKELAADVFAYGFKQSGNVYYFKTAEFLDVFRSHQTQWTRQYGTRTVYASRAIVLPVPISTVLDAVPHYKTISLS